MNQPRPSNDTDEYNNPLLSDVIERNIRTIIALRRKADKERNLQDRIADVITEFSGRTVFVYLHVIWFAAWILMNDGYYGVKPFDPFPYGLLTMIVSLEAIFLSIFVLISQNRQAQKDRVRSDIEYEVNVKAEMEVAHLHDKIDGIREELVQHLSRLERHLGR